MSELLWTCEGGIVFTSETSGVRLSVIRAPLGGGFRYQLTRTAPSAGVESTFASGHREELREAMSAAERSANGYLFA